MNSIRTKMTLLTVCAIVVTLGVVTVFGVVAIRDIGSRSAEQMLSMLCQTGEKNLDYYFESVEQSVEMVSGIVESDLKGLEPEQLAQNVEHTRDIFKKAVYKTNGVLTYYYRIDPSISQDIKGFWYVNLDGSGFEAHEVTDITLYDTQDTSSLVWFTVPKATGEPIWLPPYITDNLDKRVISYNEPIYWEDRFIGVVGIEIDYSTMAEQVNNIKLFENGYAFLNDADGNIIYHPRVDVTTMSDVEKPKAPEGLLSDSTLVRYRYEGVEKMAVWQPLSNGMRLNVTVPIAEINRQWKRLVLAIVVVSAALLVVFVLLTMHFAGKITRPLRRLTEAAEQVDAGNYDFRVDYDGKDEVGILTHTFSQLVGHLKTYISDLNNLAYADALTSVRNKGAYDIFVRKLDEQLAESGEAMAFSICMFDCDNLKQINDRYGHEKGDAYLKAASHLICSVFQHSPVFRIGGDEFAAILQNEDYRNRDALIREFVASSTQHNTESDEPWAQAYVAMGIADYDRAIDKCVGDVARRADRHMYMDKRVRKAKA